MAYIAPPPGLYPEFYPQHDLSIDSVGWEDLPTDVLKVLAHVLAPQSSQYVPGTTQIDLAHALAAPSPQPQPQFLGEPMKVFTEPPQSTETALKSIGSIKHPSGCTPCAFHCYSLSGCNRGAECQYCHEEHPKKR